MYRNERNLDAENFKERFEFLLTYGPNDTIICQRYFKIIGFNPSVYNSIELAETLRDCAHVIDEDLKSKSVVYLSYMAPKVFNSDKEMFEYFKDEKHQADMHYGYGIVIRNEGSKNYYWSKANKPEPLDENFDYGEFTTDTLEDSRVTFKLSFLDEGRVVCSTCWDGYYPYEVRKSVDLSNSQSKILYGRDVSELNLRDYVVYKMTEGRDDIIKYIIGELRAVCTYGKENTYTTKESYGVDGSGRELVYDYAYYRKAVDVEERKLKDYLSRK